VTDRSLLLFLGRGTCFRRLCVRSITLHVSSIFWRHPCSVEAAALGDSSFKGAKYKSPRFSYLLTLSCGSTSVVRFCRLQELQPLVFMFHLPLHPVPAAVLEASHLSLVQQVQQTYGVTVSIRPRHRGAHTYGTPASSVVIVRGSVGNCKAVKEATTVLFERLTGNIGVMVTSYNHFLSYNTAPESIGILSLFLKSVTANNCNEQPK